MAPPMFTPQSIVVARLSMREDFPLRDRARCAAWAPCAALGMTGCTGRGSGSCSGRSHQRIAGKIIGNLIRQCARESVQPEGPERLWRFQVEAATCLAAALPLRRTLTGIAPTTAAAGTWAGKSPAQSI